jgi:hypothetical protein
MIISQKSKSQVTLGQFYYLTFTAKLIVSIEKGLCHALFFIFEYANVSKVGDVEK